MPSKSEYQYPADDTPELLARQSDRTPHMSSITARTVLTVSVSMSVVEMDTLIDSLGIPLSELTGAQRMIQNEFREAIDSVR